MSAAWAGIPGRNPVLDVGFVLLTQQESKARSAEGDGLFNCSGGQAFWHIEDEHNLGPAVRPRRDGTGRHCTDGAYGPVGFEVAGPVPSLYGAVLIAYGSNSGGTSVSFSIARMIFW